MEGCDGDEGSKVKGKGGRGRYVMEVNKVGVDLELNVE